MLHPTHWYLNVTSYTYMYVLVHVLIENTLSQQKNDGHLLPYCNGLPDVTCMYTVVRLLVATLHVGMTRKQDGGYTQLAQLQQDYLRWVKISFTHQ